VGIEVSGAYWHRKRFTHDKAKQILFSERGVSLIQVREKGLPPITADDVTFTARFDDLVTVRAVIERIFVLRSLDVLLRAKIKSYLDAGRVANEAEFNSLSALRALPPTGESAADNAPQLIDEFHPTLNGKLKLSMYWPKSNEPVWWRCRDNANHDWPATVASRVRGNGCPFCRGFRVSIDNCLATRYPKLAAQWHPTKNGAVRPTDVTPGERTPIWWLCPKCQHEYEASIFSRTGGGACPACAGKHATEKNCLLTIRPELAAELHPKSPFRATEVTGKSNKLALWLCQKCGHEWTAKIGARAQGYNNCLKCRSFGAARPELIPQWDPENDRSPFEVTPSSTYPAVWRCARGHRWRVRVAARTAGNGCRQCRYPGGGLDEVAN
jgi:hypothetical protein